MMQTSTAQMQNNLNSGKYKGFTLTEAMVALAIASLMVVITTMNLRGLYRKNSFKGQVQDFISTMKTAARAASQSNRRYEVIIDLIEQSYTLRQITSAHLPSDVLEEEIIVQSDFSDKCRVVYVLFDDLVETDQDYQIAYFRAGRAGWQNGGKIVLLDADGQPYSLVVNRLNRIVRLQKGDTELLMPRNKNEMVF